MIGHYHCPEAIDDMHVWTSGRPHLYGVLRTHAGVILIQWDDTCPLDRARRYFRRLFLVLTDPLSHVGLPLTAHFRSNLLRSWLPLTTKS